MKTISAAMLLATLVVLAPTTACTQVLGVTPLPGGTCDGLQSTNACDFCVYSACCDVDNTCFGDPQCSALSTCANGCNGDPGCVSNCAGSYSSAVIDEYNALYDCNASCASACGS